MHVSFRIYEGVGNTSEVDFLLLNANEQMELMELTTTMSDRQKLAATAIIAQIKLTENQTATGLRTAYELQGETQKYSHAHYTALKDVYS